MQKPVMEVIKPPPPPTQSSLEMAQAAMERVNQKRTEAYNKAEAADDFSTVFPDSEKIFREELGFEKGFWVELVDIYSGEKSEESTVTEGFSSLQNAFARRLTENTFGMFYLDYIRTFDPLVLEYLRLSYEYPNQSQETLITHFRESVRNDNVSIVFPDDL